jgi:hypothetical protein
MAIAIETYQEIGRHMKGGQSHDRPPYFAVIGRDGGDR